MQKPKILPRIFCLLLMCVLSACTNTNQKVVQNNHDSIAIKPKTSQTLCFREVSGTQQKDTVFIHLNIDQQKVNGEMNDVIFEKDARRGKLNGEIHGDKIDAIWTFMQEGTTDTLALQFQLKNNELLQRPLKVNAKTGRQQTDKTAENWIILPLIDCNLRK